MAVDGPGCDAVVDSGPWTVDSEHEPRHQPTTSLPPDGRGKLKLAAAIVNMAD